jgi:hypothetical protein
MAENAEPTGGALRVQGKFRLGEVFGMSFSLFGRHLVVFVLLAAIILSPFYLMLLPMIVINVDSNVRYIFGLAMMPMVVICPPIASGVITYGVAKDLRGRPVLMYEALKVLFRRFRPIIGVAISLLLLIPVCILLVGIVSPILAIFFSSAFSEPSALIVLMMIFLALGYSIFFVAAPVCIVEQVGIRVSLSRSRVLSKDHRLQIFGALILIVVADVTVGMMTSTMVRRIGVDAGLIAVDTVRFIASFFVQAVFVAFLAVVSAVSYHQLRVAKEGVDGIASVFD